MSLLYVREGNDMKQELFQKKLRKNLIVCGVLFLFLCLCCLPTVAHRISSPLSTISLVNNTEKTDEGDVPTWYLGDQWIYTIDPLYYSGPNGSFSGTIENFKQKVVDIADGLYEIEITGDISGDLTVSGISGECDGDITGTSYVRVSDLAEGPMELHSQGTITIIIPIPYQLDILTSSSPLLELYDFPIHVGEQWRVICSSTTSGAFTIEGLYEQSLDGNQSIDETVQCNGMEHLAVPAGSYDCYTIARSDSMAWYSSDVGNLVRSVVDQSDENMTVQVTVTLQSFTRVNQPITLTEELSPSVALPGSSIIVSGQAHATSSGDPIQSGVLSITIPSTGDSWSTTTDSAGYYTKTIVAPTMIDDTPCEGETGSGGVIVQCDSGGLSGYRVQTLTTLLNRPPTTPSIDGETDGKVGVSYSYTVVTTDPDSDDVSYFIDWGDTTNSSWIGPYASGETRTISHTFTEKGTYTIKVKARDVYNTESSWGTLQVTMPTSLTFHTFLRFLERFPMLFHLLQNFLG
jgi:hypothetical protein